MLVKFSCKTFQIPDPEPEKDEIVVRVEKYICLPTPNDPKDAMFRFSNKFAKIKFFLIHEGPRLTYYKVKSAFLQKKIISEKKLVLTYGEISSGINVIAVGPQDCPHSEYHIFPKCCLIEVTDDTDLICYYHSLLNLFSQNSDILNELFFHSSYSGKYMTFNLEGILENNCKHLESYKNDQKHINILSPPKIVQSDRINLRQNRTSSKEDIPDFFLVGAGSYPYTYILPNIQNANLHTVIDLNPISAHTVAKKYNFFNYDTSYKRGLRFLRESEKPILVIATYHSTHTPIAEYALSINPETIIMIEKPPVTSTDQLFKLYTLRQNHFIEIGYNRRYVKIINTIQKRLSKSSAPITITCIVKEKKLPIYHWYYWPTQGTRIIGNLCHWIDLGVYFIQKKPVFISAKGSSALHLADEPIMTVFFEDSSVLCIIASDRGSSLRGIQEFIDIRQGDLTVTIDDFMRVKILEGGHHKMFYYIKRDKGHFNMYKNFFNNFDSKSIYPNYDLILSSIIYLTAKDILQHKIGYSELNIDQFETYI